MYHSRNSSSNLGAVKHITSSPDMRNMTKKLKWQVFPGRNKFFCNGRIIIAESLGLFYLTLFLILTTCGLFFTFDCPFIYNQISPAIPIVAVILFIFTMSCFFHTAFTDPGIIPRAQPDEAPYIEQFITDHYDSTNGTAQRSRPPPRTKEIYIHNQPVKIKYCFTCLMFRPPRASHCSVCDNCVDCFDHHCPWVGNCVGRRNYRYFYMFIISFSLLCIYVLACSLTHLILLSKGTNLIEACKTSPASVFVFLICFVSVWSILGLAGFHTFLTAVNLTTNEDLKGVYSRDSASVNPYRKSIMENCLDSLCASSPIRCPLSKPTLIIYSLIDARGEISNQDLGRNEFVQPNIQMQRGMTTQIDVKTSDV